MKKSKFTMRIIFSTLLIATIYSRSGQTETSPYFLGHFKSRSLNAIRNSTAAACLALLSTTAVSAVVVEKMNGTNPMMGWGMRERYYRNSHGLAVFLLRGLGKNVSEEGRQRNVGSLEIVSEYTPPPYSQDFKDFEYLSAPKQLQRAIYMTKKQNNEYATGYIVFATQIAAFRVSFLPAESDSEDIYDLQFYRLSDRQLLYQAKVKAKNRQGRDIASVLF